jgi:hypothetical protein
MMTMSEAPDHPGADTAEATEPDAKPDREAARYRRQLRETEAKATTLATRLEAMQRREVERMAAEHLQTPADLWLTGPELAELLDDQGDIDPAKVSAACGNVVETRPGWKRPDPPPAFDGGARHSPPVPVTMRDVLQGRRHR